MLGINSKTSCLSKLGTRLSAASCMISVNTLLLITILFCPMVIHSFIITAIPLNELNFIVNLLRLWGLKTKPCCSIALLLESLITGRTSSELMIKTFLGVKMVVSSLLSRFLLTSGSVVSRNLIRILMDILVLYLNL